MVEKHKALESRGATGMHARGRGPISTGARSEVKKKTRNFFRTHHRIANRLPLGVGIIGQYMHRLKTRRFETHVNNLSISAAHRYRALDATSNEPSLSVNRTAEIVDLLVIRKSSDRVTTTNEPWPKSHLLTSLMETVLSSLYN